ncbi:hypothetical protein HDV06_005742 [Boothiomyces sp. JEL0866]|nr:hypothetical protein HDV06_005742 [Boothiomyces sp. JEL0866]
MNPKVVDGIKAVVYGQILSIILSSTFIFTQMVNLGDIYPYIFPNELMYHLLFLVCLLKLGYIINLYKTKGTPVVVTSVVSMGAIDVLANMALLKSFEYTSGISVTLISSTSAILAVPMSYFLLKSRYNRWHGVGVIIVMIGLVFINWSKYDQNGDQPSYFHVTGSILAALASLGFAASSVIQTKVIEDIDEGYPWGALSGFGVVSSIVAFVIANLTPLHTEDRDVLLNSSSPYAWYIIGYIVCLALFYILSPLYLQKWSAVNFQMSILTADIGVYIFNIFYLQASLTAIYTTGFFVVLIGMAVFNMAPVLAGESEDEQLKDHIPPTTLK